MSARIRVLVPVALATLVLSGCGTSADEEFLTRVGALDMSTERQDRAIEAAQAFCGMLDDGQNILSAGLALMGRYPDLATGPEPTGEPFPNAAIGVYCPQHQVQLDGLRNAFGSPTPPAPPVVLGFGQTHTFPSGLAVTLNGQQCAEPTGNADPLSGPVGAMVQVTVTVVNNTSQVVQPDAILVDWSSDGQGGLTGWGGGGPDDPCPMDTPSELFPGESVTFETNVEVPDMTGNLRVQAVDRTASSYDTPDVYFEGALSEMAFQTQGEPNITGTEEQSSSDGPAYIDGFPTGDCPDGQVIALGPEDCISPEENAARVAEESAAQDEAVDQPQSASTEDQYCADNPGDPMCMTDEEFEATYGEEVSQY